MGEKKSFILYLDTIKQWDMLSDEQAGKLIKALLRYCENGDKLETDDGMLSMAFGFIIAQIDRDSEKWNTIREKRSEAVPSVKREVKQEKRVALQKEIIMQKNNPKNNLQNNLSHKNKQIKQNKQNKQMLVLSFQQPKTA